MNPTTATEYRNLPLNVLTESTTNTRCIFEDVALRELAASIRVQGVLTRLLVRPTTGQGFEIVAGADATAPLKSSRPLPFPFASSTSRMPKPWKPL